MATIVPDSSDGCRILDRTGGPTADQEFGFDRLAGLADQLIVGRPVGIDGRPRRPYLAPQEHGQLADEVESSGDSLPPGPLRRTILASSSRDVWCGSRTEEAHLDSGGM